MRKIETIGFIGTGVMGSSMAGHLLAAGWPVHVYNRTRSRAEAVLEKGAVWFDRPAELVGTVDLCITMVGFPNDVEALYFGEQGLIRNARKRAFLVDMTTSSPLLARRIGEAARDNGLHALDAPVSGGDLGAREARLSIIVGGENAAFEACLPVFEKMGKNIVLQGGWGSGQHTKMANQIAIASTMMGVCEAITYARQAGLDPHQVLRSIESGAAGSWSLSNLMPRALKGDYAPGFFVKHFIKDMQIALDSAAEMKVDLPGLALARKLYQLLADSGGEDDGTQALLRLYETGLDAGK